MNCSIFNELGPSEAWIICIFGSSKWNEKELNSLWRGVQLAYGSPSYPSMQEHVGWWFCVVHRALKPHEPIHGSWHLCDWQARFDGQSWCITHSGRQFGGAPSIPKAHEHTARLSSSRHSAFGPQGLGMQGLTFRGGSGSIAACSYTYYISINIEKIVVIWKK